MRKSKKATSTAEECGYEILPHPPYSPDLAPSDYFLFPNLKSYMKGKRFDSDEDVIDEVESYFERQIPSFYSEGLLKVIHRWHKCVNLHGDYVEQ